ncbi:PREDICTED: NADH dehydrogenase [ubiquinone] 1 alpha subcomplex subunit 6 [Polistes canadensis]|uniref:NADH dehydrogenase [ubiquinone] 1 alpha subcomplex subunit 6 n=1 Tax=Polistes canadensis TaxID=91411 RepID=UPI000718FC8B|nr:PREDICTED: NADH dehydrogenase [ubiquinone] 1 alpha subcomplex subunit 6 [Polistes canadensis]
MASSTGVQVIRNARPLLSTNHVDAHRRVLALYKAWCRQIPIMLSDYDISYTQKQCLEKVRSEFLRNKYVTDLRVIDLLIIKGQMELQEVVAIWKPTGNLLFCFKDTFNPKPKDFLGKFYAGHE